jgi:hypothetical protein
MMMMNDINGNLNMSSNKDSTSKEEIKTGNDSNLYSSLFKQSATSFGRIESSSTSQISCCTCGTPKLELHTKMRVPFPLSG